MVVEDAEVDAAMDEDVEGLDDRPQPERAHATATSPTEAQPRRPLITLASVCAHCGAPVASALRIAQTATRCHALMKTSPGSAGAADSVETKMWRGRESNISSSSA